MESTGVKLRNSQQIYYIDTNNVFVKRNALCVVETEHGVDIGRVFKKLNCGCSKSQVGGKLLRLASENDLEALPDIEALETKAFKICREKAKEKKLDMKLVMVKCLFDKTKIIFYFVAENRIDFRELVRYLASVFRTRIEMRQIGVRDEARMSGGFGPCGRQLCCVNLKEEFEPVSIKMAKEQNLNLHSLKISGMCGRLLCCLGYEYDVYRSLNSSLPRSGKEFSINGRHFCIESVDTLKELISIRSNNHSILLHKNEFKVENGNIVLNRETREKILHSFDADNSDE